MDQRWQPEFTVGAVVGVTWVGIELSSLPVIVLAVLLLTLVVGVFAVYKLRNKGLGNGDLAEKMLSDFVRLFVKVYVDCRIVYRKVTASEREKKARAERQKAEEHAERERVARWEKQLRRKPLSELTVAEWEYLQDKRDSREGHSGLR